MSLNLGKWNKKGGAAMVLSLIMVLSATACSSAGRPLDGNTSMAGKTLDGNTGMIGRESARDGGLPVHSGIAYSQRTYEHYDSAVLEQAMDDFQRTCAVEGQEEEVLRLYRVIVDEFDRLGAMTYMAQLAYDRNVSDEAAAAEQTYTTDLYSEMDDRIFSCLREGMESPYKELLAEQTGWEMAAYIQHYEKDSQEITELNKREQELIQEYDQLAAEGVTVEHEDGQWSYSRLEREADLDADRYARIEKELVQEKNRAFGAVYAELIQVRGRKAELKGYDSYGEYAFEGIYGRDYSLEDAGKLCSNVKNQIVPLNDAIWNQDVGQESYNDLDRLETSTAEDVLDTVGPAMEAVDPALGEIFTYMRQNGLYDIQSGEDQEGRTDSSYTVGMPGYGDAFIFINRNNTYMDYQSLIHEFGHFSSYYYNTVPELYLGFNVDVCEVQSQGLEMLADRYAQDMFGAGAQAFEFESVTDMLYVAITASMLQEFEETVYREPDMSLEDMNRLFKEIQDSYDVRYYDVYEGDLCYDWVDISHLFYSPMYYIGYGTSALSSLDLWTMAKDDWDGAVETYMGILMEGMDAPYRGTMELFGLRDVFDEEELETLSGDVRRLQGLEGAGTGKEGSPGQEGNDQQEEGGSGQEGADQQGEAGAGQTGPYADQVTVDVLMLVGIGTVIVLQAMILCTGFVIIWLLVKKRKDR